ncbi:MAG: glycosyltransferase family 4 protein [Scytonema sp. PMC 1069.18]|nr:glycosyltransferase family 4 protein [Scytonema sp. PMC 1069.18]MEC4882331.1 glycosyltransferase family 4 protein [Scytonema sp. PMC 1070.18]
MKILFIIPSTLRGGVEEYTLKISSAAVKEAWDAHVAFPKTEGTASLIQDFTAKGVCYHRLEIAETIDNNLLIIKKDLLHFIRTVLLLLKIKPDVVQIILPYPPYGLGSILACGLLQIPSAIRFGLVPFKWSFSLKKLKAYAWARARNQLWIAVSENNRKLICESFQIPYEEVVCIKNGTKLMSDLIASNQQKLNLLRYQICQSLKISPNNQLILTVGRLDEQKGYQDLIPVIPHITKEFPNVKFIWVGEGQERDKLFNQLQEYGVEDKVLFLGYRSDIPKLLLSADFFLFPTRFEGHPNALLEAMAHNLPIISSDASSIPEIIENNVHGLLFRTGDTCDLLETLRWALRHPEKMQEMAHNAKLRIQDFSEEKMVQETLGVLENLAQIKFPIIQSTVETNA